MATNGMNTAPAAEGETIAAISTAPGRGGVAVVRISGPRALNIAGKVAGRGFSRSDAGRFFFRKFRDSRGAPVDEGLVLVFAAPHSYTGEDCAELQGHGGSVAPRRVLDACLAAGARLARRGEFTMRAFMNGRLGLGAAEAVLDLIDAKTARSADDALLRLGGAPRARMESLFSRLVATSADLERFLDFDENDAPSGFEAETAAKISGLRRETLAMLADAAQTRVLREGVRAVLSGPPNAGKSSLLNALLGESRAIVSAEPGTTRDYIEETADIDGWPVVLIDTAGVRECACGDAEAAGIALAESLRESADIAIEVRDGSGAPPAHRPPPGEREIRCRTKSDLPGFKPEECAISVSSATGDGIDRLRRAIAAAAAGIARDADERPGADDSVRSRSALREAAANLECAGASLGADSAVAANHLRNAASAIGGCIGREWHSGMLDALFSRFCVGK